MASALLVSVLWYVYHCCLIVDLYFLGRSILVGSAKRNLNCSVRSDICWSLFTVELNMVVEPGAPADTMAAREEHLDPKLLARPAPFSGVKAD